MQPCNKQLTSPNTARPWIYSKVAVPSGHRQEACTRASTQTLTTPTTPVLVLVSSSTPTRNWGLPVATTSTQLSNKVYGMPFAMPSGTTSKTYCALSSLAKGRTSRSAQGLARARDVLPKGTHGAKQQPWPTQNSTRVCHKLARGRERQRDHAQCSHRNSAKSCKTKNWRWNATKRTPCRNPGLTAGRRSLTGVEVVAPIAPAGANLQTQHLLLPTLICYTC